jgi:hypothetical protein
MSVCKYNIGIYFSFISFLLRTYYSMVIAEFLTCAILCVPLRALITCGKCCTELIIIQYYGSASTLNARAQCLWILRLYRIGYFYVYFHRFCFVQLTCCKAYTIKCIISPLYPLPGSFRRGRFFP